MRKNELDVSLLELVFEGRNKSYGAYALRRDYSRRMGIALGIMLSAVLGASLWMKALFSHESTTSNSTDSREWMKFTEVRVTPPIPEIPKPQPVQARSAAPKVATQKFTSSIDIKPEVKDPMPSNDELKSAAVSTVTRGGEDPGGIVQPVEPAEQPGTGTSTGTPFIADERQPEFPGGALALRNFLASQLQTPSSLEEGDRRAVRVRFTVMTDGRIDQVLIETSGGEEFDREVIRVCKRMPRWVPGSQNGQRVPVQYVLPVTFLSVGG